MEANFGIRATDELITQGQVTLTDSQLLGERIGSLFTVADQIEAKQATHKYKIRQIKKDVHSLIVGLVICCALIAFACLVGLRAFFPI